MNKKIYQLLMLFFGVSLFISNVKAQPQITFVENSYDFGTISEKGGPVSHIFKFTNTGNSTLLISRVRTSCGCTSPEWTKTPIEPGMKGSVKVTYNPNGRPYPFNKSITVYSNALHEKFLLTIKGTVIRPSTIEKDFPFHIENLRLKSKDLNFRTIKKGQVSVKNIEIYNNSQMSTKVSLEGLPSQFTAKVLPATLKPKQKGLIQVTFNSNKTDEWGTTKSDAFLKIDGITHNQLNDKISIHANIVEDFSGMTIQQKRNAPIAQIKSPNLAFGKIKQGKKVKGKIYIQNVGGQPLKIRKIINTNDNLTIKPKTLSVATGKSGKLVIYIDTKGRPKGNYKKAFRVITNDPINTTIVYTIDYQVI